MLVYKRDWSSVSGYKVLFTVTHHKHVRRKKKGKKIDWKTVVREHITLQIEEHIFTGSLMDQG